MQARRALPPASPSPSPRARPAPSAPTSTMPMVSQPPKQIAELLVRLAEELDEDARQRRSRRRRRRRRSRAASSLRQPMGEQCAARGTARALRARPRRAGSDGGRTGPPFGKTKAQGTSDGLPQSSELMKLAMRTRPSADRRAGRDDVEQGPDGDAALTGKQDHGERRAEQSRHGTTCRPSRSRRCPSGLAR